MTIDQHVGAKRGVDGAHEMSMTAPNEVYPRIPIFRVHASGNMMNTWHAAREMSACKDGSTQKGHEIVDKG